MEFTQYHSQFLAHRITLEGVNDEAMAKALTTARVDMNPHQVDGALFALQSPLSKGVLLADEVGLGKTIEASLVIAQRWAQRRRRILLIVPASLRKQWSAELWEKFGLPSQIMDTSSYRRAARGRRRQPFDTTAEIIVVSYEFASRMMSDLRPIPWDLVVFDEAHRLRNTYRKNASARARALREGLRDCFKLLLTATPLQNSIMELYGLISMIDDGLFADEASFRLQYAGQHTTAESLAVLRQRLEPVCRRTLRQTVQEAGHISYTKRTPVTFRFEPHPDELTFYERLSAFLQRPDTHYLGGKPNALITMSLRKILGSSCVAISDTLTRIIDRLKKQQSLMQADLGDLETVGDAAEELAGLEDGQAVEALADRQPKAAGPMDQSLAAEIRELEDYRGLARAITASAKSETLVQHLPSLLDTIESKGGKRKAVIFTESVRTQTYLAELLSERGFAGDIVLLNGSNSDRESGRIHGAWVARHTGGDQISGARSADMKAAIVEAFRDEMTILLATESGAEGINLQFCSLLINYDLPWNPQRVEQRIGRCHRYGQKIDVTVVNFLNTRNRAEERVFELLDQKFQLFDGVFGASDDVLGAIESGIDFERRVHEIVQSARTVRQVEDAFAALTRSLEQQIAQDMHRTRDRLLQHMDEGVVRRLRFRHDTIKSILSMFDQRLITLAQAELPSLEILEHHDGSPYFIHAGKSWTTGWPLADQEGWQFFRLGDGTLAQQLVDAAKARLLPPGRVLFDYSGRVASGLPRFDDVAALVGQSGWLRVSKLVLRTAGQAAEHLVAAGIADDGSELDPAVMERLFLVPGTTQAEALLPPTEIDTLEARLIGEFIKTGEADTSRWLQAEAEKVERFAEDLEVVSEREIQDLQRELLQRRAALRVSADRTVQQTIEERRAINRLSGQLDDKKLANHRQKQAARSQIDAVLAKLQADLAVVPAMEPLFSLRWHVM